MASVLVERESVKMKMETTINLFRGYRSALKLTVAVACLGMVAASPASAATFVVHKTAELETAVAEANLNGVANTIELTAGALAEYQSQSVTNWALLRGSVDHWASCRRDCLSGASRP